MKENLEKELAQLVKMGKISPSETKAFIQKAFLLELDAWEFFSPGSLNFS